MADKYQSNHFIRTVDNKSILPIPQFILTVVATLAKVTNCLAVGVLTESWKVTIKRDKTPPHTVVMRSRIIKSLKVTQVFERFVNPPYQTVAIVRRHSSTASICVEK